DKVTRRTTTKKSPGTGAEGHPHLVTLSPCHLVIRSHPQESCRMDTRARAQRPRLTPSEWERLLELADHFEEAWRAAGAADLAAFLRPPEDPLRLAALEELIKTDLEQRCRRREPVDVADYVRRFPELGAADGPPPWLLFEEYRARYYFGDKPSP